MASSVTPLRRSMAQAIFGVFALSCGIPSPSHQAVACCWAMAASGRNAGDKAARLMPRNMLLRETTDSFDIIASDCSMDVLDASSQKRTFVVSHLRDRKKSRRWGTEVLFKPAAKRVHAWHWGTRVRCGHESD